MEDKGRESDHLMLITPERVFYAGLLGRPRKRTPGSSHVYVAVKRPAHKVSALPVAASTARRRPRNHLA